MSVTVYTAEENGGKFKFCFPHPDDDDGGKDSKHESVSISTPTSSDRRLDLTPKRMMSDFKFSLPDFGVISDFVGHYSKSESETKSSSMPCVMHMGVNPVAYCAIPDDDEEKDLKDTTTTTTTTTEQQQSPDQKKIALHKLLEVVSVVIKNNNKKNNNQGCVSLYGTIRIIDVVDPPVYIYNTERDDDSESISFSPGSDGDTTASLLLTGLSRPIFVNCPLCIDLDLMYKEDATDADDDDVFYKGKMNWDNLSGMLETYDDDEKGEFTSEVIYRPPSSVLDKPLSTTFYGKSGGSVTINYLMLREGVGANVEVTLLNLHGGGGGGDGAAAHIYGLIQAGSNCESFTYWSVLLQKKNDEHIDYVRPGDLIPMSRSFVTVNGNSSLKVSLELYDRLRNTDLSQGDDEIVKGTVDFPAQTSGTSEKNISGCYGEIRVKVTWTR